MKTVTLALCVASALVGCTDSEPGGDTPGGEDAPPFTNGVSTLTGRAEAGFADGERGRALFNNPVNVHFQDGTLYVADFDNNKVRTVDATTGETTTLIQQPNFRRPFGFASGNGTLYVSTDSNSAMGHDGRSGTIWEINGSDASIVAENVGRARSMVVLDDGRIAFTDYQSHVVQLLDPSNNQVEIIAGSLGQASYADGDGAAARFNQPYGIVQRADGTLLVADQLNNRLRVVTLEGTVTTLGGSASGGYADGAVASAQFNMPQGLAQTASGDVYITDLGNYRVRRLRGDTVDTVAGSGTGGYLDADDKLAAELYGLEGLSVNGDGSMVFLADGGRGEAVPYNRIRTVKM